MSQLNIKDYTIFAVGIGVYDEIFWGAQKTHCLAEAGPAFRSDGPLFASEWKSKRFAFYKHLFMFARLNNIHDYSLVMLLPDPRAVAVFNSQKSCDAFDVWVRKYALRFSSVDAMLEQPFPRPGKNSCKGTMLGWPEEKALNLDARWEWILEHCDGEVYFMDNGIFFESDTEAVAYRMVWA